MADNTLKIAICDDQALDRVIIQLYVNMYFSGQGVNVEIDEFSSGDELLEADLASYSLITLDVFMNGVNGIDTAKKILAVNKDVKIMFCTSSPEFIAESSDMSAFGYFVKPLAQDKFYDAMDRCFGKAASKSAGEGEEAQVTATFSKADVKWLSLMTINEFKKAKAFIPVADSWWWLQNPGSYSNNAAYVFTDGEAYPSGYKVDSDIAYIRPLCCLNEKSAKGVKIGDKVKVGENVATFIGDCKCLFDNCVCRHRFDISSNAYETSEIKQFIESDEFAAMIF